MSARRKVQVGSTNLKSEGGEILPTTCILPSGDFVVADPSVKKLPEESIEIVDNVNEENDDEEHLTLFIVMSNSPLSSPAVQKQYLFHVFFTLDVFLLFISIVVLLIQQTREQNLYMTSFLSMLEAIDLVGRYGVTNRNIRALTFFIIMLFNRIIICLLFIDSIWLLMTTIPTGIFLLLFSYFYRNTLFSSYAPVISFA